MAIFMVVAGTFLINIFFGYWRATTRKFSLQWFLAVHIPVPIAIGLRLLLIGWIWYLIPAFVLDYAAGQYLGGKLRRWLAKQTDIRLGSFLPADLGKIVFTKSKKNTLVP